MTYQQELNFSRDEGFNEEFLREQKILHSGDLERIVTLAPETIKDHFGEESFEYLALEQKLADEVDRKFNREGNLKRESNSTRKLIGDYIIPRRTENPANTFGMLRNWIVEFHNSNGMKLPKGFYRRNKMQLRGMYYGMLKTYSISIDDVVPENC